MNHPVIVCVSSSAVLWTGEVWDFLSFTERHPSVISSILLFGLTSALGQVSEGRSGAQPLCSWDCNDYLSCFQTFIFMTVVSFGPLTCSIVTTTRKFFTILGSVILFGNVMTSLQWVGTVLVFLGEGPSLVCRCSTGLNCSSFS